MFTGCYTERTAQRQVDKAHHRYPMVPAKFCAEHYDPTDSTHVIKEYIQGEDIVFTDTVTEVMNLTDTVTIVKYVTRTVKTTDTLRDTKYVQVENKAAVKVLEDKLTSETLRAGQFEQSRSTWRLWCCIGWGIIGVAVAYVIIKLFVKSKTKMVGV